MARDAADRASPSPCNEGFGLTALRAAAYEAAAHADISFEPEGLVYTLEGPLTALEEFTPKELGSTAQVDGRARPDISPGSGRSQKQLRILVVEDEPLVAIELQSVLEGEGHAVVGPAMNLARGLDLARADGFDLAFLDISLGEEKSFPIARELARKRIPFAFVTGYTDINAVPEELRSATRIQKPYGIDDIRRAIGHLASRSASGLRATA